jgi:hypothetical protein
VAGSASVSLGRLVEWAVAEQCKPGERISGDACLVERHERGVLAAAIDGLGHGEMAAAAACAACGALAERPGDPLDELMRRCDRALAKTRGAAVTLARFDPSGMSWLAVGNVSGILVRPAEADVVRHVPLRGGIVGARLPRLRDVDHLGLRPGDLVVLATDGVRSAFSRAVDTSLGPHAIADRLLHGFASGTDDALVLVVRYLGEGRQ